LYKNNQLINLSNQITTTTTIYFKMYANNNNNNNKRPFCKVCADAGKTDTAHYVRLTPDPKSPVVCPTLLALECRYCFKLGHTVKYCALAKKNNKLKMNLKINLKINRDSVTTTNNTTTQDKPPTNSKFAALLEEEQEQEQELELEQEQENNHTTSTTTQINNTWASIAKAKPKTKPKTTTTTVQPVDNYQYYRHCEDYSRSPNLGEWLSEPDEQQQQQQQEIQLTLADKYGDRLYEILYEYFKNEFHRERTGKVVGMLIESSSEQELEECMTNPIYLEDRADEAWALLREFDPPVSTIYRAEVEDW
jgi:hypothetical protein